MNNITSFLDDIFRESKKEFFEILKKENSKKLFELIDKINTFENKEKNIDSSSYSQILYNITIGASDINFYNIAVRYGCHYLTDIIDFLKHIDWCIDDDGMLSFLKMNTEFIEIIKKPITMTKYSFSSRFDISKKTIEKDVCKFSSPYRVCSVESTPVDYKKLFSILNEIITDENWEYKTNKFAKSSWYDFNYEKAFEKYF